MCFDFFEQERFDAFEFIVLISLPTRSMLFMISAHDLIAMYLAIEPQSLCFYVIAASKRKSEFSTEAGSKYLILDFIGCDIDLTQVLKERIERLVETLYVVVYLGGDRSTSFSIVLGLCLDLLRAKSEGLVPT
ncbi:NADH-ubiquinone oxidoreductase chain 2-like [Amaranthus tricolor]|uniref:NADH-ubiquinone oxidoreductase chain 2-like n=1 Tax=Amaranthus tricolor TaxID=29722 RepID=UPI00258773F4|nr:NADH-ubiquinone oxidoreductase chain 2-like [Amaranthus tricolor]